MASATDAISMAVAVLEMNKPSAVITNKVANTRRGAAAYTASAARSTPPVRCKANENGNMPTIRMRGFQLIER
jgi:hypothetical protein